MLYFDYEKVACEAHIPTEKLQKLYQVIRKEFPKDDMLCELHLLRVCMAIKKRHITIADVLPVDPVTTS